MVNGLGAEVNPLAPDEDSGANLEGQVGVEIHHDRGYSGDRECTKCLPTVILYGEVEE